MGRDTSGLAAPRRLVGAIVRARIDRGDTSWRAGGLSMIRQSNYSIEPWCLREESLDLDALAQSESLFTLSNGHIGWRANLDEGDPHGLAGSYLNGVHELRPLPYAEIGFGYPERDQVIVNVTDGKVIRLLVDDEPFDVRYGELHRHERQLDFRAGVLHREVEWSSPSRRKVKITSTRIVSFVQRSVGAIKFEVEALDQPVRVVLQSELVANEPPPAPTDGDPRAAAVLNEPWEPQSNSSDGVRIELIHRSKNSELTMAAAMDHLVTGPPSIEVTTESFPDLGRVTFSVSLAPGERVTLTKFVSYAWSAMRSMSALRDQVDAALAAAHQITWDGLVTEQRDYLDDFWDRADVEVEGDAEIQQSVRFSLFHLLQASARAERRSIPAKGLTGTGYDGHAFWDTESFVLPVLSYTAPETVADALNWRYTTLATAQRRALQLGFKGAAFPWRTISGAECSSYWPAGTVAFHVNADIADAVVRYLHTTDDQMFERAVGLELLVETARLWRSLGHHDARGRFRIDGVTGPDEYSAIADNNVYTNLMARRNLRAAATIAERHPDLARRLAVNDEELASWRIAADEMVVPFDETLGVHSQSEGFTTHQLWNFEGTTAEQYPLLLHFPYFDLYRKQVIKQADLELAMFLCGDDFSEEHKRANFDYYERLTVRDSSLSACTQSILAAELGYLDLAYDYLGEAAMMDLDNLEHNTSDGLHLASLAGTWLALVAGLAGMRAKDETLRFAPRLPEGITRLAFKLLFRGRRLNVETTAASTTYQLSRGDDLELFHYGRPITVSSDAPTICAASPDDWSVPTTPAPDQPAGRAPLRRNAPGAPTTRST